LQLILDEYPGHRPFLAFDRVIELASKASCVAEVTVTFASGKSIVILQCGEHTLWTRKGLAHQGAMKEQLADLLGAQRRFLTATNVTARVRQRGKGTESVVGPAPG
jgi:hypothetical protein